LTAAPVTVADGLKKLFDAAIADAATSDVSPSVWIEDVNAACRFSVVAVALKKIRNEPVGAGFVVVALLAMRPILAAIPKPALAAVIVSAAIVIIDVAGYRSLWKVSREEFVLAVVAAVGVLSVGVLAGVLVAVILTILIALYRIARPHDAVLGDHPDADGWVDIGMYPQAVTEPGLVVFRFDAPLFFINADRFRDRVEQVLIENPGQEEWLILDFEGIGALDATALDVLAEVVASVAELEVRVVGVARANDGVIARLTSAALLEPVGSLRTFATINAAVKAYRRRSV
jgi:MFS superfamily sulfate permease-like transporter